MSRATAPRKTKTGTLRVIGGRWRGRKIDFPDVPGLRPTPDRARETLFNWLQKEVDGARCLDLFSGSGALGFEAASRGAAEVILVDRDSRVCEYLKQQSATLGATQIQVVQSDARACLETLNAPFDIVFLDPPFGDSPLAAICAALAELNLLKPGGKVYLEAHAGCDVPDLPPGWAFVRSKRAGQVSYHLLESA
ncbi:MAG: 16S rRNA (guanine(966)-N(2))-methyltransferase RsmD [Gammaproteobacteria bacterium]